MQRVATVIFLMKFTRDSCASQCARFFLKLGLAKCGDERKSGESGWAKKPNNCALIIFQWVSCIFIRSLLFSPWSAVSFLELQLGSHNNKSDEKPISWYSYLVKVVSVDCIFFSLFHLFFFQKLELLFDHWLHSKIQIWRKLPMSLVMNCSKWSDICSF